MPGTQPDSFTLGDPELVALRTLSDTLAPFDAATRRRMLEWLVAAQAGLPAITLPMMDERRDEPHEQKAGL